MKNKNIEIRVNKAGMLVVVGIFLAVIFFVLINSGIVSAQYFRGAFNTQYSAPGFQQYYNKIGVDYREFWPILDNPDLCEATQDFILMIKPGSCSPAVVRSDLLEEQNVPVFCQVDAIKLNPLIDVSEIGSVQFFGRDEKDGDHQYSCLAR